VNNRPLNNNANAINGLHNINNHNKYQNFNAFVDTNEDLDGDDFDDHDGEMNDAGEVIQESNTRPLRPGQIPIEIQRIRNLTTTSTTPKSTHTFTKFISNVGNAQSPNQYRIENHANNFSNNFDNEILHKPIIQRPRPFSVPHTPSKKQQNNHVISYDHGKIGTNQQNRSTITSKPKVTAGTTPESNRIQVIWSSSNYTITPFAENKNYPATTPKSNWMDTRITTVSEARSYDETTIQPPTKSFRNDYDSKPSSQHPNDEANTMAERDLGSTFLLPHTHLYKPDRGSDISGFESL
ncbi:hypothetical protein AMK59_8085, partial [Oryctes borbonicus]